MAAIEKRRREYLQLSDMVANFVVGDVTQPEDAVAAQGTALVEDFYAARSASLPAGV